MAYNVKLLSLAENDLDDILKYLSQYYPGTPLRFLNELDKNFNNLNTNPKMYPKYKYNNKYRRFVIIDFLGFYKIDEKNKIVNIYRVLHGKQDITTILEKI